MSTVLSIYTYRVGHICPMRGVKGDFIPIDHSKYLMNCGLSSCEESEWQETILILFNLANGYS